MPQFEYIQLDRAGGRSRGRIEATSVAEARRKLRAAGLHVVEISNTQMNMGQRCPMASRAVGCRKVRLRDLSAATRQLAGLLHAGVPLVPSLSALVEQLSPLPLASVFGQLRDRVSEGIPFATALSEHPEAFSEIFVSMVRAGEAAGTLESVLRSLAEMTETQTKLIGKVKSAMAYPLFMAIVGVAVVVFIFAFVVPSLTKLFLEMNRPLPWPTVLLIRSSGFMERYFFVLAAVLGIVAATSVFWLRTTHGRTIGDQLKLRLPLFGGLIQRMIVSRFSRTLAILLSSGLSIVEALELSKRVIGNMVISTAVDDAKDAISRGDRIADAFQKGRIFPPILIHMIAAGEKSGGIEEGLGNIADAFDNEVETSVRTLTSLLEPAMIVLLGIIVGFIVLAILLPIFDINQAIV